ncbi:MAG: protein-glutamate O-methyltransferase CheR [Campylobacteraceae bacterium]|nr:protein-glutamate O-methyltransferase CheR [Campylobacteraceae bacterium]
MENNNFVLMESTEISLKDFILISKYIYDNTGIVLAQHKITLVKTRLQKRLYELKITSFNEYYEYLCTHNQEYKHLVNEISTNVTSFFREESQWQFLKYEMSNIRNKLKDNKLRIWSAACSTGEEPYTVAMFLKEELLNFYEFDIKILATDISHNVLSKASKGIYSQESITDLPKHQVFSNFTRLGKGAEYRINDELSELIMFREFNLVYGDYSLFRSVKFDIIFIRNVMIYFDKNTNKNVIQNLVKQLNKGGYLFIGHSESLLSHEGLNYIAPSIYRKS